MAAQYALLAIGALRLDEPLENQYFSNPLGLTPIIGTVGAFTGDAGAGPGIYQTLNMAVVPEPSTILLNALGLLGLLWQRR